MATTDDLLQSIKDLLIINQNVMRTLDTNVTKLSASIAKIGTGAAPGGAGAGPTTGPAAGAAHEAHVKELVDTIKRGLEEGLTPLVESLGRGAVGGGPPEGGGGDGGGDGGGGGGHDYVGAKNEIRIASQITGTWEDLRDSFGRLLSARDNFADAREQQIEILQEHVASLQRQIVQTISGKNVLESLMRQREESLENVKAGLGGLLDTIDHNFDGVVTSFGHHARTFAGGAISFSQAVKLIQGTQSFYGRFEGGRDEFSRQVANSMDQVEQALSRRGESIYDYQSGSEFRQMNATLVDIYGLNAQTFEEAASLRRLDTPGNIRRTQQQLDFLREVARNTGRTVDEVMALRPDEATLESMNKAGLNIDQSDALGRVFTLLNEDGNTRMIQNIQTALEGISTGRGIGAFEDNEALTRGEAQAALDLVYRIMDGQQDQDVVLRQYLESVDQGNHLNIVGMQIQNRAMLDLSERLDRRAADQTRGDQNPLVERLGNMFSDFFENQVGGQMLAAGAGVLGGLVTATHANTLATWALNLTMGARGPLAQASRFLGDKLGWLGARLGGMFAPLARLFGLAGGATTAAAGSGLISRIAGGTGSRVIGGAAGLISGGLGFANGVDQNFQDAFDNEASASVADAGSNLAKMAAGALALFPPTAIFGVIYTAVDSILEMVFGAGLSDAIGYIAGAFTDALAAPNLWEGIKTFIGKIGEGIAGIFTPMLRALGIVQQETEEAADETEENAREAAQQSAEAAGRVINITRGDLRQVVFPDGQINAVDRAAALQALSRTADSEQGGYSDSELLQAVMQGGRMQARMVAVLEAINNEQRQNGRFIVYNTDPTVGGGRR